MLVRTIVLLAIPALINNLSIEAVLGKLEQDDTFLMEQVVNANADEAANSEQRGTFFTLSYLENVYFGAARQSRDHCVLRWLYTSGCIQATGDGCEPPQLRVLHE